MSSKKPEKQVDVADNLEELLGISKKEPQSPSLSLKNRNKQENPIGSQISDKGQTIIPQSPALGLQSNTDGVNLIKEGGNFIDVTKGTTYKIPASLVGSDGYVSCPPGIQKVYVTQKAFDDMIMVAQAINEISKERWGPNSEKLEVYMYVFADPDELDPRKPARISSIYIPFHRASEARVDVDETGILDVKRYIEQSGKVLLGWAHSHGHFAVYSSQTDEINHQILLNETSNYLDIPPFRIKYVYGITINDEGERFGVILNHYPCGHVQRETDNEFDISGPSYTQQERKQRYKELKELVEERATLIKPNESKSPDELINALVEEIMYELVRNTNKAKDLLFHDLSEDEEKMFFKIESILNSYDSLLMDGMEETIKGVARKLMNIIGKMGEDV